MSPGRLLLFLASILAALDERANVKNIEVQVRAIRTG